MRRLLCIVAGCLALFGGSPAFAVDALPQQQWPLTSADGVTCCLPLPPGLLASATTVDPQAAPYLQFPVQTRDAAGLRRDTAYFMGYQFAAVAILYMLPESVTNWTEEDRQSSVSKYWDNVTSPQMDSDDFYLNWIIHPYWGASYFVRARERGYSNTESFWYAVLLSTMFEYGAEAMAEEPSYQDLVITPVLGSLVGVWFMDVRDGVRERTAARGYRSTGDKWIWVLTDPLGAINRQVDKLFGVDVDAAFMPYVGVPAAPEDPWARPYVITDEEPVVGLNLTLNW